jgi:dTDP-4-dehydrorhamnose reductase
MNASTETEIETAFAAISRARAGALVVAADCRLGVMRGLSITVYSQPGRRRDGFLTTILRLLRSLPAYPMSGDGRRLQPAYGDDVAAAIAEVVRQGKKPYPIYELAGPRVYSYEELLRTIAPRSLEEGLEAMLKHSKTQNAKDAHTK